MLKRLFNEHPNSVGETYVEHAASAFSFGLAMIGAGLACLIHGVLPFAFKRTGSEQVAKLYNRMVLNRTRVKRPMQDGQAHARG